MGTEMYTCPVGDKEGDYQKHEWRQGQIKVPASERAKRQYYDIEFEYVTGYYCIHCTEERPRK